MHRFSPALLLTVLLVASLRAQEPPLAGGFPEGQATITELLVHFDPELARPLLLAWEDLARGLPSDVRFQVGLGSRDLEPAARYLLETAGIAPERVSFTVAERGEVTVWARDRALAIAQNGRFKILSPHPASVAGDRVGDVTLVRGLVATRPDIDLVSSQVAFEGGNVIFTHDRVLVGYNLVAENEELTQSSGEAVLAELARLTGRTPLVLGTSEDLPHEHLDMYLTVIGPRQVLLADPEPAAAYLANITRLGLDRSLRPGFGDFTAQDQMAWRRTYDALRRRLENEGYTVHRLPVLHGAEGDMLTWNNALVENRDGERRAYVPVYGLPELDNLALETYRAVGVRPFPVRVSGLVEHGGTVRCTTNVIGWRSPRRPVAATLEESSGPRPR